VNVFDGATTRYPSTTLEEAAALGPDLVLAPTEPYPFAERHLPELQGVAADAELDAMVGAITAAIAQNAPLTIALAKSAGGVDNRAPRPSLESLSGWRQRADWAHRNHFEAFPAFAAAVFVAELTHAPQSRIDQLAGIFVLLRVIYTALYVADQATLRSVVWSLGLIAVLWLFVLGV